MNWLNRYRLREFLRSSFWLGPSVAVIAGILLTRGLRWVDAQFQWTCFDFTPEGAKALLAATIASMLTFIVIVASSLLVVVQLVSGDLTPRIIAPTFRHPLIRAVLCTFILSYTVSVAAMARVQDPVPQFTVGTAASLNVLSIMLFVYFVGAIGLGMRPIQVMTRMIRQGHQAIFEVYPAPYDPMEEKTERSAVTNDLEDPHSVVTYEGTSGVLIAFDPDGLVRLAVAHNAVIQIVPRVGDYVAVGEPMFRIHGAISIQHRYLRRTFAMGPERTFQQDPRLAFRNIADIACKALSPAINDPTTTVLAVDHMHRLLRWVGTRNLLSGIHRDSSGVVRLIYSTPTWEDFVWVATAEIRRYGGNSMRVMQRQLAMLQHLIQILPESRHPPLREHMRLLNQAVDRNFVEPEDRERVRSGAEKYNGAAADA